MLDTRPSPLSSHFGGTGSEESGSGDSVSLSSQEQERELQSTPTTTDGGIALAAAVLPGRIVDAITYPGQDGL